MVRLLEDRVIRRLRPLFLAVFAFAHIIDGSFRLRFLGLGLLNISHHVTRRQQANVIIFLVLLVLNLVPPI